MFFATGKCNFLSMESANSIDHVSKHSNCASKHGVYLLSNGTIKLFYVSSKYL